MTFPQDPRHIPRPEWVPSKGNSVHCWGSVQCFHPRVTSAAWWTPSWRWTAAAPPPPSTSTTARPRPATRPTPASTSGSPSYSCSRCQASFVQRLFTCATFNLFHMVFDLHIFEGIKHKASFFQAALFYIPRKIWKTCEGGLIRSFGM